MRKCLYLLAGLLCAGAMPAQAQPYWIQESPATSPSARSDHAMAYDAGHGQTVLFGGGDSTGDFLGDTWVWDGTTWTQKRAR